MWTVTADIAMLTEINHVNGLKWEVVAVHESLPAGLPAGYSFPTLSKILNSAPEEKQSFPNILSQLRCDPATYFCPITTLLQQNTALSALPHTWNAVKPNRGPCQRYIPTGHQHRAPQEQQTRGKCERKFLSGQLHYFRNSRFPSQTPREENKRDHLLEP